MTPGIQTLRQMRIAAGKSQFQISRETGIERTRLSLAENGHVELRAEELAKLDEVLRNFASQRCQQLMDVALSN